MPERKTMRRAQQKRRQGRAPSTQAGEFVREEVHHVREGKHGARSPKQAIAIGLSKARRAGVAVPPPKAGKTSEKTRRGAERDYERGQGASSSRKFSPRRRASSRRALRRESTQSTSRATMARQTRSAASRRSSANRSAAARRAARTKGSAARSAAARKAARTRARA